MNSNYAVGEKLKAARVELLWLVGSYVVALLLMRGWLGHATLDIQLHNTYFVLRAVDMAGPLATAVALVAAVGRLISSRWRTPYTVAALVALAATWLLFVALGFWWLGSGLRR